MARRLGRSVKTRGPPHGLGRASQIESIGRDPARPTNFLFGGPRPGPAHQILRGWAAARPGPSNFGRMGRGQARPIKFSDDGPRPGPAHHIFKNLGPARRGPHLSPMTSPVNNQLLKMMHKSENGTYMYRPLCQCTSE